MNPDDNTLWVIADVSADGSLIKAFASVEGRSAEAALERHLSPPLSLGSTHAARLKREGTVRFAVAPANGEYRWSQQVSMCSIRFFDVTLGALSIQPVGA